MFWVNQDYVTTYLEGGVSDIVDHSLQTHLYGFGERSVILLQQIKIHSKRHLQVETPINNIDDDDDDTFIMSAFHVSDQAY